MVYLRARKPGWVLAAGMGVWLGLLSMPALATPVAYAFSIDWTDGQWAGTTSVGSFAYDSSIVDPGRPVVREDVLSQFSLDVADMHFDLSNVSSPIVFFDDAGRMTNILLGTECMVAEGPPGFFWGGCVNRPSEPGSFVLSYGDAGQPIGSITMASGLYPNDPVWAHGVVHVSAVPELSTAVLLVMGLGVLAGRAGRQPG